MTASRLNIERLGASWPSWSPILDDLATHREVLAIDLQQGAAAGSTPGWVTIGWGRQDRVTLPRQAARAQQLFPDAVPHWFERCGHFPMWDQPGRTAELILARTGQRKDAS